MALQVKSTLELLADWFWHRRLTLERAIELETGFRPKIVRVQPRENLYSNIKQLLFLIEPATHEAQGYRITLSRHAELCGIDQKDDMKGIENLARVFAKAMLACEPLTGLKAEQYAQRARVYDDW